MNAINLKSKFDLISDHWQPKIIGELNNQMVKIAKVKGEFVWHDHANEDELFYVIKGQLKIEFRDKTLILNEGEMTIIPKGVEHKPVAEDEVWLMLFEPSGTINTGETSSELTIKTLDKI